MATAAIRMSPRCCRCAHRVCCPRRRSYFVHEVRVRQRIRCQEGAASGRTARGYAEARPTASTACWAAPVAVGSRRTPACFVVGAEKDPRSILLSSFKLNIRLELGTERAITLDAIGRSRGNEVTMANAGSPQSAAHRAASTNLESVEIAAVALNGGIQKQLGTLDTNLTNREGLTVGRSQATVQASSRIACGKPQQDQDGSATAPACVTRIAFTLSRSLCHRPPNVSRLKRRGPRRSWRSARRTGVQLRAPEGGEADRQARPLQCLVGSAKPQLVTD